MLEDNNCQLCFMLIRVLGIPSVNLLHDLLSKKKHLLLVDQSLNIVNLEV